MRHAPNRCACMASRRPQAALRQRCGCCNTLHGTRDACGRLIHGACTVWRMCVRSEPPVVTPRSTEGMLASPVLHCRLWAPITHHPMGPHHPSPCGPLPPITTWAPITHHPMGPHHPSPCGPLPPITIWAPATHHHMGPHHPSPYGAPSPITMWAPATHHPMGPCHPSPYGPPSPITIWAPATHHHMGPRHPSPYGPLPPITLWAPVTHHHVGPCHPSPYGPPSPITIWAPITHHPMGPHHPSPYGPLPPITLWAPVTHHPMGPCHSSYHEPWPMSAVIWERQAAARAVCSGGMVAAPGICCNTCMATGTGHLGATGSSKGVAASIVLHHRPWPLAPPATWEQQAASRAWDKLCAREAAESAVGCASSSST